MQLAILAAFLMLTLTGSSAVVSSAKNQCIPSCCAPGSILDPSGTRCLSDRSREILSDPCGRRDSFLPTCEIDPAESDLEQQEQHHQQFGPKRRLPIVESLNGKETEDILQHEDVLLGLSRYAIKIHGSVVEAFYVRRNDSRKDAGSDYEIPSSFCIDPNNNNVLLCPPVELDSEATVYKCCPFGKQLQFPIYSGCQPLPSSSDWGVPVQGRRLPLANLIRFPSELLRYDKGRHSKLESKEPCGPKGRLLFDLEAFQVDRHGSLAFTRVLGPHTKLHQEPIDDFCLDMVSVAEGRRFMAAVFCLPDGLHHTAESIDESTQKLLLPSAAAPSAPATYYGTVSKIVFLGVLQQLREIEAIYY